MKTQHFWPIVLLLGASACAAPLRAQESVEQGFKDPPASARPHTWWHWINGNITKAGITADLEAMKRAGVGGAQIFNVDVGVPAGKTPFMSPQWREAMAFAMKEAKRLGIEICVHNCAGWSSSGGPWIQPEHAMQFLTWSETPVQGSTRFSGALPPPASRLNFYRDIAVFAVKKPEGETADRKLRLQGMNVKAGFERGDHIAPDASPTPEGMATPNDGVLLVTDHLPADGKITWDAPAGEWTLIRMGYTPTGETNHPAPQEGLGLECDKLSREAMDAHWSGMMADVLKDAGPLVGQSLNNSLIDSYEVGSQNWTPKFREEFRKRRGYDPFPWLPVVTGRVIGSRETSERFLWDFRRTICDLFADNYFAYFGELCRKNGLKFSVEPYGNGSFDNLQAGGLADIPMGEFWVGGAAMETTKLASSAAHTNGRKFVGAESFTADEGRGRWLVEPYSIKALGDRIFSLGINRYIFHRYAHQPWLDLKPGMTMGPWGTHFERTVTWWNQGSAWLHYVGRCQYLLQSGLFAADVLYYEGDEGPNDLPFLKNQAIPFGYDYDGCDATVLMKARVEDGQIVLPSGMRYRLLMLPDSPWMTPATLHKIEELTQAGATILGAKPTHSPSLSGYPACDADVQKTADAVWGTLDGKTETDRRYGKGRVLWGKTPQEALTLLNILPDVSAPKDRQRSLVWLHRRLTDGDYYFVANQRYSAQSVEVAFRVTGKRPELWHPETGVIEPASVWREENGQTVVPLRFGPAESVFVVFRKPAPAAHLTAVTLPAGSGKKEPVLEIKEAYYEAVDGAGKANVTQKVAAMIASGETSIMATNDNFGDPTPLHVKRLRVVYLLDGKRMEQSVDENQALDLGGSGGADTALPEMEIAARNGKPTLFAWTPGEVRVSDASGRIRQIQSPGAQALPLTNAWTVHFPPNLGAPAKITLPRLISWTEHEKPGVRYFSGTATYDTTFEVPANLLKNNQALFLDLGRVKNIAEVRINGGAWTTLWKAPFRVEVTGRVQSGTNRLEVRVTNLWPNRLIGDEQEPAEVEWNGNAIKAWPEWMLQNKPRPKTNRITFTTWRFWQKDSPLLESGLLGPVTLQAVPTIPLNMP